MLRRPQQGGFDFYTVAVLHLCVQYNIAARVGYFNRNRLAAADKIILKHNLTRNVGLNINIAYMLGRTIEQVHIAENSVESEKVLVLEITLGVPCVHRRRNRVFSDINIIGYIKFRLEVRTTAHSDIPAVYIKLKIAAYALKHHIHFICVFKVEFSAVLLIASIAIAWIYGLKIKDTYDGFVGGSKELLPMSIFTTLSFVILMPFFTSQTGQSIIYTVFNKIIGLSEEVSILPMTILSSVGTFFYGQFIYLASDLSTVLQTAYSGGYSLMTFIMQTIYGLTLFVTPTSALLLGGLSYFDIGYKEWIKHIYKFVLITLGILLITFLIIGWVI